MALFGKKKDENATKVSETEVLKDASISEAKASPKAKSAPSAEFQAGRNLASVIQRPRITEKAALAIDRNVYAFIVRGDATKHDVRDAVKEIYNVTPVKIRTVKKQPRHYTSRSRGRDMMEKGMKKAYVYLKKGDRIDLV